jgi:hypothetical protein
VAGVAAEWTAAELAAGVVRGPAAAAQDSDWPLLGWLRELLFEMGASARADFLQFVTVRPTSSSDEISFLCGRLCFTIFSKNGSPMKQAAGNWLSHPGPARHRHLAVANLQFTGLTQNLVNSKGFY